MPLSFNGLNLLVQRVCHLLTVLLELPLAFVDLLLVVREGQVDLSQALLVGLPQPRYALTDAIDVAGEHFLVLCVAGVSVAEHGVEVVAALLDYLDRALSGLLGALQVLSDYRVPLVDCSQGGSQVVVSRAQIRQLLQLRVEVLDV